MPALSSKNIEPAAAEFGAVAVPEFGRDEHGDPYYVNVRGLTVHEWHILLMAAFDPAAVTTNGEGPAVKTGYDEICHVAAMAAHDDGGDLAFAEAGETWREAAERLKSLPLKFRPALVRIHKHALSLSGFSRSPGETVKINKKKSRTIT